MQATLNHRFQNSETANTVREYRAADTGEKAWMSVKTVPASIISGVTGYGTMVLDRLRGRETDFYGRGFEGMHYSNTVRGERATEFDAAMPNLNILGLSAGDIYQAGMSGLDSLATSFIPGGYALLGMGAAANKGYDLSRSGASADQIFGGATAAGAIELAAEKIPFDEMRLLKSKDVSTWLGFLTNVAKQSGVEYLEEGATELLNGAADLLNRTTESDWAKLWEANNGDFLKVAGQVLQQAHAAGMSGAFSGGSHAALLGAPGAARGISYANNLGAEIKADSGYMEMLKEYAGNSDPAADKGLAKYAGKTTADSSDNRVGNLYLRAARARQASAVMEALRQVESEGYSPKEAGQILEMSNELAQGGELSKSQHALWDKVKDNPAVMEAARVWEGLYDGVRAAVPGAAEAQEQTALEKKGPYTQLRGSIQDANSQAVGNEKADTVREAGPYEGDPSTALRSALDDSVSVSEGEENDYRVSAGGRAVNTVTNKTVTPKGFVGSGGSLAIATDGGNVSRENISYADEEQAVLYESILNLEIGDADYANFLLKAYTDNPGGVRVGDYVSGMRDAFVYGQHNIPVGELMDNPVTAKLTPMQRNGSIINVGVRR